LFETRPTQENFEMQLWDVEFEGKLYKNFRNPEAARNYAKDQFLDLTDDVDDNGRVTKKAAQKHRQFVNSLKTTERTVIAPVPADIEVVDLAPPIPAFSPMPYEDEPLLKPVTPVKKGK
jgi:hypothetical protein